MCTDLTITAASGGLPIVVNVDFTTEDAKDCLIYECLISKIISPCTKNEIELGNSQITILVQSQLNDTLTHRLVFSFKMDGILKSFDTTLSGNVGLNATWIIVPGLYYKNASKLENLTASFTS